MDMHAQYIGATDMAKGPLYLINGDLWHGEFEFFRNSHPVEVRAKIVRGDAFSGHADKTELSQYVRNLTGRLAKVSVIHGEEDQSLAFSQTLKKLLPGAGNRSRTVGNDGVSSTTCR